MQEQAQTSGDLSEHAEQVIEEKLNTEKEENKVPTPDQLINENPKQVVNPVPDLERFGINELIPLKGYQFRVREIKGNFLLIQAVGLTNSKIKQIKRNR